MIERVILLDGFAYCEVKQVYDKSQDGNLLCSKKGESMISIAWNVVDKEGNNGSIRDYLVGNAFWKIKNLENALNISGLYNVATKRFNIGLLSFANCAAVINQDENPQYGSKIKTYVPLSFVKLVTDKGKLENDMENNQRALNLNVPKGPALGTRDNPIDEDDDIPF